MTHEEAARNEAARQAEHKQLSRCAVDNRNGFMNETGLVFLEPKAAKRVAAWRKKMEKKGYKFPPQE